MTFKAGVDVANPQLVELYKITLEIGTIYHLTDHEEDFLFDSQTYESCAISRDDEGVEASMKSGVCRVTLGMGDTARALTSITNIRQNRLLDRAQLTLYQVDATNVANYRVAFKGTAGGVTVSRLTLEVEFRDMFSICQRSVPTEMYSESCQHTFGDAGCVVADDHHFHGTTEAGGSSTTIVDADLVAADGYYNRGMVEITYGALDGERAPVRSYVAGTLTLLVPLSAAPAVGVSFVVYPTCEKARTLCDTRFSNTDNFLGFEYVPRPEQL